MIRKFLANIFYGAIYFSGIWLIFRYLNRRRIPILMYHGIVENETHLWTQIPLAKYERQLEYVTRRYHVLNLSEVIDILRKKKEIQPYALAITFDDGFYNNLSHGYKVLKKHNLQATIFLTTAFIDKSTRFGGLIWTDYIAGLFRNTAKENIDLRDIGLWAYELSSSEKKAEAARRVCVALKELPSFQGYDIIKLIGDRLGSTISQQDCDMFKSLNWSEIKELNCDRLISFGAHTVDHEILTKIPFDDMVREIKDSKTEIEQKMGVPVRHFAYPNGGPEDFNSEIREIVAKYFDCALTTIEDLNSPGDDLYLLNRIGIGSDIGLWKFKLQLAGVVAFAIKVETNMKRIFNIFGGHKDKNGQNI